MDENKMGWREYARYAEMSAEELARDCEVQIGVSDEAADQAKLTLDRMLEYAAR